LITPWVWRCPIALIDLLFGAHARLLRQPVERV
jgi:hypothetical protein